MAWIKTTWPIALTTLLVIVAFVKLQSSQISLTKDILNNTMINTEQDKIINRLDKGLAVIDVRQQGIQGDIKEFKKEAQSTRKIVEEINKKL